ncbi:MAG: exodeoxyribonuclease III [Eubacteriales bacterium]|jgi:exodeoxyribonuclease-3|nr:exodeoxyribonuclease III [Eubacteriales bacterium]
MKLISWNVNGLRAVMKKNFFAFLEETDPDILCLQETKMQEGQAEVPTPGYHQYWCSAERKGYSGTLLLTKEEPQEVSYGIGMEEHDREGRVITARYPDFTLVNVYVPNAGSELVRLDYRMQWEDAFRDYLTGLAGPVIVCGDMNVAHKEIDLKNPRSNRRNAGFTQEERDKMTQLQEAGFTDSFRYFYPDREGAYSWWSYRFQARKNNAGWRIDYFLVSDDFVSHMQDAAILSEVMGSDHCPVVLELK